MRILEPGRKRKTRPVYGLWAVVGVMAILLILGLAVR